MYNAVDLWKMHFLGVKHQLSAKNPFVWDFWGQKGTLL